MNRDLHIQYKDSHSGMDDHTRHTMYITWPWHRYKISTWRSCASPVKINILINSTSHGVIAATTGYHRVSSDGWISVLLVKLIIMCDWSGPHCVFDFLPIFQGFNLVPSMIRGHAASSVCLTRSNLTGKIISRSQKLYSYTILLKHIIHIH